MKSHWKQLSRITLVGLLAGIMLWGSLACAKPAPAPSPTQLPASKPSPTVAVKPSPAPAPKPSPTAAPKPAALPANWPKSITIATSQIGTSDYVIGVGIAKLITKYVGLEAQAAPNSTRSAFPKSFQENKLEIASTSTLNTWGAWVGELGWKDKPIREGLIGFGGVPTAFVVLAHPSAKIKTPKDLIGKTWIGKLPGSSSTIAAMEGFTKAYGITEQNSKIMAWTTRADIVNGLKERTAEAAAVYVFPGDPAIADLSASIKVEMVSLSDEAIVQATAGKEYFSKIVLPKGSFESIPYEVQGFGMNGITEFRRNLPDDLVYAITKAIFDHQDEFEAFHPDAKYYRLPLDAGSIVAPVHPGAVKYLKEKGFWKKAHEDAQAAVVKKFGIDLKW
ncbi:MAG: TAXI family TRAP transporter solute-binding subunit [Chloroflexi bacterium]|nr:TAXI family TRAP transporter solute-binding subunit [Chloroflexota bacterium]